MIQSLMSRCGTVCKFVVSFSVLTLVMVIFRKKKLKEEAESHACA